MEVAIMGLLALASGLHTAMPTLLFPFVSLATVLASPTKCSHPRRLLHRFHYSPIVNSENGQNQNKLSCIAERA